MIFPLILAFFSLFAQRENDIVLQMLTPPERTDFLHFKTDGSRAQNSVSSISQDTTGQIWISTKNGLIRYNGKKYYVYTYEAGNPHSITDNFTNNVFVADDGSIWVTSLKGLSKYRSETDDFITIRPGELAGKNIFNFSQDKKGIFWFTTPNELFRYDEKNDSLQSFSLHDDETTFAKMLLTRDGHLWLTTSQRYFLEFLPGEGVFRKINLFSEKEIKELPRLKSYVNALAEDHDGKIWIATHFGYLFLFDPETQEKTRYYYRKNLGKRRYYYAMTIREDEAHNLWLGTWFDGLYKILPDRRHVLHFMPTANERTSLSNDIICNIFQDKAGYLWFGSEFAGANILRKNKKFSILPSGENPKNHLPPVPYTAVAVDSRNRVWVGTDAGGLGYFDRHDKIFHPTGTSILKEAVRVFSLLLDKNGFLWIGTERGLHRYNTKTQKTKVFPYNTADYNSISGKNVLSMLEDSRGNLWFGTIYRGLTKYDVSHDKYYHFAHDDDNPNSLSNNYVSSIIEDDDGNIWVGTENGLNKLNALTGSFTVFSNNRKDDKPIHSRTVNCLYKNDNILWIGTEGGGLTRYDFRKKTFKTYFKKDGLPSNNVRGITGDDNGNLWISTPRNIVKFNIQTAQFVTYDNTDGLENSMYIEDYGWQNLEFLENFSYRDADGYVYFGGISGICIFHPDSLPHNDYIPPVIIEQMFVNGKKVKPESHLTLHPNENHLEFFLTTLNFIQPKKNNYAHYLENYDSAWIYTAHDDHVEYFDLPPGKYTFRFKGSNNDNYWNEHAQPLTITILPHFYQTKTFYIAIAVFAVLLFFAFRYYKWHIKKQLEKQQALLRYSSSNLKEELAQKIVTDLREKLAKEPLYLEPGLTLYELAKSIDVSPHHLSQVINQYYQCNFQSFINTYRIDIAKKLLRNTSLKILAVAYDSGFKSISTFNVAFKKETGMSPTQYRKKKAK